MNAKRYFWFYAFAFVFAARSPVAMAITTDELAQKCKEMESAICDVSLDYTLYYPSTLEERLNIISETGLIAAVDNPTYKLCVARPSDLNDLNSPSRWLVKVEESMTLTKDGDIWDASTKYCYNGKISKQLDTGSARGTRSDGYILDGVGYSPYSLMVTPIGFSVFRPSIDGNNKSLSDRLKNKDCVCLYNTVQKVDGFNTIRADFLGSKYKTVYMRVYFSIEHGYTPVKYEHMTGARLESPESNRIAFSYTVGSLEKVAEGLWFPSSGFVRKSDDTKIGSMYDSTSKIVVNQGLTDKHFDIEFPPGTKVQDEIRDLEYIVGE